VLSGSAHRYFPNKMVAILFGADTNFVVGELKHLLMALGI
jgi:hypothetical protein